MIKNRKFLLGSSTESPEIARWLRVRKGQAIWE